MARFRLVGCTARHERPSYTTLPRTTVRRHRGTGPPGVRSGSPGVPERGSVLQAWMRSSGAWTTRSPAAHTASVAGAPRVSAPAPGCRAARHAPRVCAANAALTLIRWPGWVWNAAARTPSHGVERRHRGCRSRRRAAHRQRPARRTDSCPRRGRRRAARRTSRRCRPTRRRRRAARWRRDRGRPAGRRRRRPASRRARAGDRRRGRRRCRHVRPHGGTPRGRRRAPASPMTWKPACSPAAVHAATWSRTCSDGQVQVPVRVRARRRRAPGTRRSVNRRTPSAFRSPASPARSTPSRATSAFASASSATSCPR